MSAYYFHTWTTCLGKAFWSHDFGLSSSTESFPGKNLRLECPPFVDDLLFLLGYLNRFSSWKVKVLVAQSCPTLCRHGVTDCSPPGSSIHGILQARMLEWVAIPFSRGSSQSRDWTQVSCTAGRLFIVWATREAHSSIFYMFLLSILQCHKIRVFIKTL